MTENQRRNWNAFCSEPLEKIEHYEEALAEGFKGWCMHHRLEIQPDGTRMSRKDLKDKGLYYDRPAEELVFMRNGEHMTLHMTGMKRSTDTCKKMSASLKGKHRSAETRQKIAETLKGRTFSEEHRQKIAAANRGKHNWTKDSLWWNDGISNKRSKECPGPEWKRGQLKKT